MVCAIGIWCIGYKLCMNSLGGMLGTGLDFNFFTNVPEGKAFNFVVLYSCA